MLADHAEPVSSLPAKSLCVDGVVAARENGSPQRAEIMIDYIVEAAGRLDSDVVMTCRGQKMNSSATRLWFLVVGLAAGCSSAHIPDVSVPQGNAALGIAEYKVTDTAELTTIVGLDANKKEIGKLELVHGRYVLGEEYEELAGSLSEGRKLTTSLWRDRTFQWETIGFTDTLSMPALPSELSEIAAFHADVHVRPLLETWKIGWVSTAANGNGEVAYDAACTYSGLSATACNGNGAPVTCAIPGGSTTPAGNRLSEYQGVVVDEGSGNMSVVDMCCGNGNDGGYVCGEELQHRGGHERMRERAILQRLRQRRHE